MGYCDFVYRRDNILGYSGDLNKDPTVYFVCGAYDDRGYPKMKHINDQYGEISQILFWFGHITQAHGIKDNIGREMVTESWSYSIANMSSDKLGPHGNGTSETRLQESYHKSEYRDPDYATPDGFTSMHVSRTRLIEVGQRDIGTLDILVKAISRFPKIKNRYGKRADNYIEKL